MRQHPTLSAALSPRRFAAQSRLGVTTMRDLESAAARLRALLLVAVALLGIAPCTAGAQTIEAFYGSYAGEVDPGELPDGEQRKLSVRISEAGRGFKIHWRSSSTWPSGRTKDRHVEVEFAPADRSGLYASLMKKDLFGNRQPLDPLDGSPYIWARIERGTLITYAFRILQTGGYEIEVFERRLVREGLELTYRRVLDDEVTRELRATLKRVK